MAMGRTFVGSITSECEAVLGDDFWGAMTTERRRWGRHAEGSKPLTMAWVRQAEAGLIPRKLMNHCECPSARSGSGLSCVQALDEAREVFVRADVCVWGVPWGSRRKKRSLGAAFRVKAPEMLR